MVGAQVNIETEAIALLRGYKKLCGKIKVLERQPVGMGIYVTPSDGPDKLQALHKKLKDMPSYMYLTKKEQDLETTAHAYLTKYPTGVKAQHNEIRWKHGADAEDQQNLIELSKRIKKVIEARNGNVEGYEGVLKRLSDLQDLQDQKIKIDNALESMAEYRPHHAKLLIYRYIEGYAVEYVANELGIVRRTFDRWRKKAVEEFAEIMGISDSFN